MARLHGIEPPPPASARVLELGCGAGVNLLAIASAFPESVCTGIDLDAAAIDRGCALAGGAGLENAELVCADLREVAGGVPEADYIIVHGVFSWVDAETRTAIMRLCAAQLAPNGVAMISYNALPGWHLLLPAQKLARRAIADLAEPEDRVEAARRAVAMARDLHGAADGAYARVLSAAAERYERLEPGVLLWDDIADIAVPFWLEQVATEAGAAGLAYLGEALPEQWWLWRVGPPRVERIKRATPAEAVARQQFADVAAGTDFKASLFVRRGAGPALEPDAARLSGTLALAQDKAATLPASASPAVRAVNAALIEARPLSSSPAELAAACGVSETVAVRALLQLVSERRADLFVELPEFASRIPYRPEAPALARAQARAGPEVTSLRHEQVTLEQAAASELLSLMDGTRDRPMLANELARITSADRDRGLTALDEYLERLTALGLLRA